MANPLPPGPPLPAPVQAGLMWLTPVRFLHSCHRRYGDRFTIRLPKLDDIVYLTDPDDIRLVFRGDPAIFHAGEANALMSALFGAHSVVVVDGERHRRVRAMMMPAFHGDSVRRQVAQMAAITAADVAHWPVGEPFPVYPRMQAISLEVILRAVIGVHEKGGLTALRRVLPLLMEMRTPLELLPPPRMLRRLGPWRRRELLKARVRALLADEITRCRRDPRLAHRPDVLAMLVRSIDGARAPMPDDELIDQLLTLLFAGQVSTAATLAWTFERLIRDPVLLGRTVQAAMEGDDAWLDAVCMESLRARPVIHEVARKLTEPVTLAGCTIPAGTMLAPCVKLVHRSARNYPDPEEFRPQRFLDQRADMSVWLPFGGGARRCLGATFAQVEIRTVLREVLRRVELIPTSAPGEAVATRYIVLVPRHGAMLSVRRRLPTPESLPQTSRSGDSLQ